MEQNISSDLKNYVTYHPNGQIKEQGRYYIDEIGFDEVEEFQVPIGEWRGWYENGKEEYVEHFNEKGENDGIFIYWNADGTKTREWYYKNGEKHGPFKIWFGDGKKSKETTYIEGKKEGLTCEWYENGNRKMETTFKKGLKNGIHTEWNENGEKTIEGEFTLGVLTSKKNWGDNI